MERLVSGSYEGEGQGEGERGLMGDHRGGGDNFSGKCVVHDITTYAEKNWVYHYTD